MNSVAVETTQNVSLSHNLAGVGSRVGAFLIDYILIFAYLILVSYGAAALKIESLWVYIPMMLSAFLYFLLCEVLLNGQTVGKMALNIKVVMLDGSKPTLGAYLLRWIMMPVDFGILSGAVALVSIVVTQNGQRLGDLVAGTTVVKLRRLSLEGLQKKRALNELEEGYEPRYPQAQEMSDAEVRLMDAALKAFNRSGARAPMEKLQSALMEKYAITTNDLPIRFLHTLQKDHAYYEREKYGTEV